MKTVRFADKLVQDSPVKKFVPQPLPICLTFGPFHTTVLPDQVTTKQFFGRSGSRNLDVPVLSQSEIPVKMVFW